MYRSLYLSHSSVIIQFSLLDLHQHFFVSDQDVQVPLPSAANTPTLLLLSNSVPAANHPLASFLRCCFVWNSNTRLHCWSSPMLIPHLEGHILVLHRPLDKITEKLDYFLIFHDHKPTFYLTDKCTKAAHILHVSGTCSFSLYWTVSRIFCICVHRH